MENKKEYKLCYIDENKAWFTDDFENQWGDDWNDRPYECNAGEPYDSWYKDGKKHKINHKTLYFETTEWETKPCNMGSFSVEDINKKAVAWIHTDDFNILAGTTYEDFIEIIEKHGGQVYVPRNKRQN